jgi:hypothetical protein
MLRPVRELLPNGHIWWRIADRQWRDPLDPDFAATIGGRWNPANSFRTLYLNEDQVTARLNLRNFISRWPFEPEDLRTDTGPLLVGANLPGNQTVCDVHTRLGVAKVGLHQNYPFDLNGDLVSHEVCQPIGAAVHTENLRGIRARSAQSRDGVARELAWFPASLRSRARATTTLSFERWYWG